MNKENIDKLITEALAIEAESARESGAIGYMARAFVQASLPHSNPKNNEFTRKNGSYTLTMIAPSHIGLPYGSIPRLLLSWIATEVIKTKKKELVLGNSLSDFMSKLEIVPTGGRWGSITRLKNQMQRLFTCSIHCTYENDEGTVGINSQLAQSYKLWWNPKNPDQSTMFDSMLILGDGFYNEIVKFPVPIDMRALMALKKSPMALDIYCWLTYRMFYLKKLTTIPWPVLQMQFGSGYANNAQGARDFKKAFKRELKKVYVIYSDVNIDWNETSLILKPSRTHISSNQQVTEKLIS